jgi:hypothetical protein
MSADLSNPSDDSGNAVEIPPRKGESFQVVLRRPLRVLLGVGLIGAASVFVFNILEGELWKDPGHAVIPVALALTLVVLWYGGSEFGPFGPLPRLAGLTPEGIYFQYRDGATRALGWKGREFRLELRDTFGHSWKGAIPGPPYHRYFLKPPRRPGFVVPESFFTRVLAEARAAGVGIAEERRREPEDLSLPHRYYSEITHYRLRGPIGGSNERKL